MQKLKSFSMVDVCKLIKSALLAVMFNLIGVLVLAIILKFSDLNISIVNYINNAIKVLSVLFMVIYLKKKHFSNLLVTSILSGILYFIFSFAIFSALNKTFIVDVSCLLDLVFTIAISVVCVVIVNLISKKA